MLKRLVVTVFGAVLFGFYGVVSAAADTAVVIVSHEVADYGTWRKFFDAGKEARKKAGATDRYVMRDAEKPNVVIVVLEFKSAEEAKKFASNPGFRERVKKASATGTADIKVGAINPSSK